MEFLLDNLSNPKFGIILGVIVWLFYALYSWLKTDQQNPNLSESVLIFLSSAGVVAGLNLFYIGLIKNTESCQDIEGIQIYICIGGLAVIWASIETILPFFKKIKTAGQP